MAKKLFLSTALIMLTTSAFAADLPSRNAPPMFIPPPIPVFSWTGMYLGAEAGYGFGSTEFTYILADYSTVKTRTDGFVGGGTLGYNRQLGNFVVGLEGDVSYADMLGAKNTFGTNNPLTPCLLENQGCRAHIDYFGTGRGRIGYAWDRYLAFATGGIAFGGLKGTVDDDACPGCSIDKTRVGYTVGGGLEFAAYENWSLKIEYLYTDLSAPGASGPDAAEQILTHDYRFSTVRAGINYRFFDAAVPVVAKY